MIKRNFLFTLILSAMLIACGDGATKKLVKELNSSYDNDGKEVELVGYVTISSGRGGGTMVMNGKITVGLANSNWQQKQDAFAYAKINFGQEPNSMWLPEKYQLSDVEIYDSNGQKHDVNTEFTIKGTVHYTNKDWKLLQTDKPAGMFANSDVFNKMKEKSANESKKAAEDREKKTGDPNDYSFEIIVNQISVAK